jgi:hypothetical protein
MQETNCESTFFKRLFDCLHFMQIHWKCLASNQIVLSQLYNCYMLMQKQSCNPFSHSTEKRRSALCYPEDTNKLRMMVWVLAAAVFFACSLLLVPPACPQRDRHNTAAADAAEPAGSDTTLPGCLLQYLRMPLFFLCTQRLISGRTCCVQEERMRQVQLRLRTEGAMLLQMENELKESKGEIERSQISFRV